MYVFSVFLASLFFYICDVLVCSMFCVFLCVFCVCDVRFACFKCFACFFGMFGLWGCIFDVVSA